MKVIASPLAGFRGLGNTGPGPAFMMDSAGLRSESNQRALATVLQIPTLRPMVTALPGLEPSGAAPGTLPPAPPMAPEDADRCACYASAAMAYAESQGIPLSGDQAALLTTQCAIDPNAMMETINQLGFRYADRCRPFHMKRMNWIIGGAVLAAGAAALLLMR